MIANQLISISISTPPSPRLHIKDIFQNIAAKAEGEPCCDWVGDDGAGHFVKMVHNGIEYGDMQLICEAYHVMKEALGLSPQEMGDIFEQWNKSELDSFLIEITKDILQFKDSDGKALVEKILDSAGQVRVMSDNIQRTTFNRNHSHNENRKEPASGRPSPPWTTASRSP